MKIKREIEVEGCDFCGKEPKEMSSLWDCDGCKGKFCRGHYKEMYIRSSCYTFCEKCYKIMKPFHKTVESVIDKFDDARIGIPELSEVND